MKTILILIFLGLLAACATPERRIRANPEAFAALPEEQQTLVREGKVDLGMNPEAVRLALGAPHRIYTRRTEAGETTVWSYVRSERRTDSQWVHVPCRARGSHSVLIDVDTYREVETLRLEFADQIVTAIESMSR